MSPFLYDRTIKVTLVYSDYKEGFAEIELDIEIKC